MHDFLARIQWSEVNAYLTAGYPSLAIQLLAVNATFLIMVLIRRLRQKTGLKIRRTYFLQEFMLLANLIVVSEAQIMPYFQNHIEPVIYKFKHQVL